MIQYVVTAVLILFSLIYFFGKPQKILQEPRVIIAGPNNSSKTKLYFKLAYQNDVETISSHKINKMEILNNDQKTQLIDIPGYAQFRQNLYQEINNNTTIIFCINSHNQNWVIEAADYLYQIFVNKIVQKNLPKLVILTNEENETVEKQLKDQIERKIFALKGGEYQENDKDETINDYLVIQDKFEFSSIKMRDLKFKRVNIQDVSLANLVE